MVLDASLASSLAPQLGQTACPMVMHILAKTLPEEQGVWCFTSESEHSAACVNEQILGTTVNPHCRNCRLSNGTTHHNQEIT